jgi:hypothetical protein
MMDNKDNYTGPTLEEMDRAARMMEANIPPIAPSRLEDMNPMPMPAPKPKKAKAKSEKKYKSGGSVSSASKRADGCCTKGKTKGRMV